MNERLIQTKSHTLVVNEIFYSIQGESSYAGLPCIFIRLTYCDVRCGYCDTNYAFNEGKEMLIDEIMEAIRKYNCKLVEVTGGEPLLQSNVHELLVKLCQDDYEVLLETGGSLDISKIDPRVKRIIDFKCPSSNVSHLNYWENINYLKLTDEVKFVISDRTDYEWAKERINEYQIDKRCSILMSVVYEKLVPRQLSEWILKDNLNVRFQLQLQKYIWGSGSRGV